MGGKEMKLERIRNLREDHDLTQEEMAAILGVKRSTYAMWELGDIYFPIKILIEIKEKFHTNIDYLLGLSQDRDYIPTMPEFTLKKLGQNMKSFRLSQRMSQKEFGEKLGLNQSAYAYYEYGYSQMTTKRLIQLGTVFDVSIDWLCSQHKN